MYQPLVISVILNTNRREDTLECLESLTHSSFRNHKIIVLDNASSDGSVQAISSAFPSVQMIKLEENRGYAGNNNVGIKAAVEAGADWIFVLNEDTILDPECLARLVDTGERNPNAGMVGPMVYHHDEPDVIQSAGGRLDRWWESSHLGQNEKDRGQFCESREVDWISGCALLIRRAVIVQAGMIDERFFYYWEETEWCIRAARKGWQIVHVPPAKLWHKGVRRNYQPKPAVTYYNTRNRLLALKKHKVPLFIWIVAWFRILRTLTSWTIKPKWRNRRGHRTAMWRGLVDFLQQRWGGPVQL